MNQEELDDYLFSVKNVVKKKYNECVINSTTIGTVITECMKVIESSEQVNNIKKIKFSEFLCTTIHDKYRLSRDKREIIINNLVPVIYDGENILVPIRLRFLRFHNQIVSYNVSCDLYKRGIRYTMEYVPYFQILKYILKAPLIDDIPNIDSDIIVNILDEFEAIFEDRDANLFTKMEIADIFLLNGREERGNEILELIREEQEREQERERRLHEHVGQYSLDKSKRTVYDDTQNVHNTDINKSVLQASIRLISIERIRQSKSLYPDRRLPQKKMEDIKLILKPLMNNEILYQVLERIQIDTTSFRWDDNVFGLQTLFLSLYSYIENHRSKKDLYERLSEELTSMNKYCSTGHLSRLINVIQGFSDDEKLYVRISNESQIKAVVTQILNMSCCDDEKVMDSMMSDDKGPFYTFIVDIMNKKIPEILTEYGDDVLDYIVNSIKKYSQHEHWKIEGKQLVHISLN
jgi:hypothetical protein